MTDPIKLGEIIADLKARDYFPHRPICDNDGVVEVFAKYNFSYPVKARYFYVLDNDLMPVFIFVANDGDPANNGLYVARDISLTPTASNFTFTNTKVVIPGLTGSILSIDNVSPTRMVVRTDNGLWSVNTNGDYRAFSSWTCEKLVVVGTAMSQLKSDNGFVVTWDHAANRIIITDSVGTVKSNNVSYQPSFLDTTLWRPRSEVVSDSPNYGVGHIIPAGVNTYWLYQTRILFSASDYQISTMFCKFTVNADGSITWLVNPATAGWRIGADTQYCNMNGANTYGFFWSPDYNKFYMADMSQWVGYAPPKISSGPDITHKMPFIKYISIPDTSLISKSAAPGWYWEIGTVGSDVYGIRAGADTNGLHFALSRYTNVNGVPTIVSNGLPDGSTIKEVMVGTAKAAIYYTAVKKNNLPYLYYWNDIARTIQAVTFNAATSNVTLTTVKTYAAFTPPNGEQLCNAIYDQFNDRLFFVVASPAVNGGHKLYQLSNSGVLTLIGAFGVGEYPAVAPVVGAQNSLFLDLDRADPMFWLAGAYPVNGGWGGATALLSLSGAKKGGASQYIYNQNFIWSKLLNKYVIASSPSDQSSNLQTYDIDASNNIAATAGIVFKIPAPVGLNGFVSNGMIHLGGYTTEIYDGLARNGQTTAFTLPANATCYLYLIRIGADKLKLKVSTVNEANTFYKVQLASFVTSAVGITSTTVKTIGTF